MSGNKLLLGLAVCSVLTACTNRTSASLRAIVSETLNVRLTPSAVPQALRALQANPATDDPRTSLQIQTTAATRRTSDVQTSAYVEALESARRKATAIATHEGLRLGAVRSVEEVVAERGSFGYIKSAEPQPLGRVSVAGPANGIITLAVTFDAGKVPISVFGTRAEPLPQNTARDATGLSVTIRVRDENLSAAQHRMSSAEQSVRDIVRRYGATATDIAVTMADANTY